MVKRRSIFLLAGLVFFIFTQVTKKIILADGGAGGKDRLVDRVKRFLNVDNDDTEELHNKYRETSKDREEKIKLFEEQLNIKVTKQI